jgi:hypothetical protein
MNQRVVLSLLSAIVAVLLNAGPALAANTGMERFHLKRQNCQWTPEMGQFIYDCLKRGDGFGAHWCHNGAMDKFCPEAASDEQVGKPAAAAGGAPMLADGTTKLERFHLKHGNCPWTPEMGQFIYECLKRGDGFGAHWCHNGAMEQFCPSKGSDTRPADAPAQARPSDSRAEAPEIKG